MLSLKEEDLVEPRRVSAFVDTCLARLAVQRDAADRIHVGAEQLPPLHHAYPHLHGVMTRKELSDISTE